MNEYSKNPFSLSSLMPKIFLLPFSKALAYPKQKLVRFLSLFMYVLLLAITTFMHLQFYEAETASDLIFPASIISSITILFLVFATNCFHAFFTVGKDWDKAIKDLNIWVKEFETKGKTRYILRRSISYFVLMAIAVLVQARRSIWLGAKVSILVIAALVIIGILLAFEFLLWHLNLKHKDSIERELWQLKGSSGEQQSILSSNI